ncbi:MAG: type I restriction endonuclease subunit R [Candidatus Brocadia sp.]|nr:type I restriction endonuclease subunit R [Candidatus Brocadia sp.]
MAIITEKDMEALIEADLIASGYFKREPERYDKSICLDQELLINFIIATQPEKWEEYTKQLGDRAKDALLSKIKDEIDRRGTLKVLRKPFITYGVYFDLVYFKPASGLNVAYQKKYQSNIFSVMRQVKYSAKNEKSLDMALFLNGIPIATLELKDRMTGSGYNVENAIKQYQVDRDPREPLFKFCRCLVHFALDEDLVYMTTHLKGAHTFFLPFNKGNNGEAGNPPTKGFSIEYLWKEVLQRDSFLELLKHFIQVADVLDEDGKPTDEKMLIFPRYQQMDAVRELVTHAKEHSCGKQYLIQHSAGSGKSYTISWLAHQLSNLHDRNDQNVFDSIIVVTDRRVLDKQLRTHVIAFEQNPGVVAGIEKGSIQLKQELEAGTKIIVTTLQKFPYIEDEIKKLPGKRFAIIIDEAHSSSSGEMSKSMKKTLNLNEEDDPEEEETTWEDEMIKEISHRGRQKNVSYFAFTATPKPKTLELFGSKQKDGSYKPFHIYSMKQAIQEGFIKDVLANYTTYKTYFQLVKKVTEDPNYDKAKATRLLKVFVELSEHTIERKTAIIIQHFMENCLHEIPDTGGKGQAKAMIVCSSRAQAVKYKIAFDKYIKEHNIPFKALVAFSGTVEFEGSKGDYSESRMNGFPEDQTAVKFRENQYKFLIVANKFQTGFDQPLLYAMYVNKKLVGVNAVQTLSRLNRVYPGKKDPITLDFVNEAETIRKAFQDFYEDTTLSEGSDPDKLYSFKRSLDEFVYYTYDEINQFAKIFYSKPFKQEKLSPILNTAIKRFQEDSDAERREKFRAMLKAYVRVYAFLSQIISFSDAELEKLYVFGRILLRKLPYTKERLPREVTQQVDLDSIRIQYISKGLTLKPGEGGKFKPGDENPMGKPYEFIEPLSFIIRAINEKYRTDFNDADKVVVNVLMSRVSQDEEFGAEVKTNPKENVWWAFQRKFNGELQNLIEEHFDFYKKVKNPPAKQVALG